MADVTVDSSTVKYFNTHTEYRVIISSFADGTAYTIPNLLKGEKAWSVEATPYGAAGDIPFIVDWDQANDSLTDGKIGIEIQTDGGGAPTNAKALVIVKYLSCANQNGGSIGS